MTRLDGNNGDTVSQEFSTRADGQRGDLPSMATIETVATATDTEIDKLPPLYDVVDPDALDDLLSDPTRKDVSVSFAYAGCDITVTCGVVTVEPELHSESPQLD